MISPKWFWTFLVIDTLLLLFWRFYTIRDNRVRLAVQVDFTLVALPGQLRVTRQHCFQNKRTRDFLVLYNYLEVGRVSINREKPCYRVIGCQSNAGLQSRLHNQFCFPVYKKKVVPCQLVISADWKVIPADGNRDGYRKKIRSLSLT